MASGDEHMADGGEEAGCTAAAAAAAAAPEFRGVMTVGLDGASIMGCCGVDVVDDQLRWVFIIKFWFCVGIMTSAGSKRSLCLP